MLIDRYSRTIDYLRISVTDRCNLRCFYCMPPYGISHKEQDKILSFEEIVRIAGIAAALGICKIRITGGEPLVRKDIPVLIEKLRRAAGLSELTLTTNGVYLKDYALSLREAGLDRINVSLDSLMPEKFRRITRGGELEAVFRGMGTALSVGLPLKVNMVLMKDSNTDEIAAFAGLTRKRDINVRFIEYMPTYLDSHRYEELFFSAYEAKLICGRLGKLMPVYNTQHSAARIFRIEGFTGTVGFISPISEPFCSDCNKLRLTADGCLKSCLHSPKTVNLKLAMDKGGSDSQIAELFKQAVALKPASHNLLRETVLSDDSEKFSMCQIGG